MSNSEINRQIVQEGLRRRAAQRRQALEDARHEALEKDLRAKINSNSQTHRLSVIAAEEVQRRNEERMASEEAQRVAEIRRQKREACHEAAECSAWYLFLVKVFTPLLLGAAILSLTTIGSVPITLTAPFAIFAGVIGVDNYVSHYLKKR